MENFPNFFSSCFEARYFLRFIYYIFPASPENPMDALGEHSSPQETVEAAHDARSIEAESAMPTPTDIEAAWHGIKALMTKFKKLVKKSHGPTGKAKPDLVVHQKESANEEDGLEKRNSNTKRQDMWLMTSCLDFSQY